MKPNLDILLALITLVVGIILLIIEGKFGLLKNLSTRITKDEVFSEITTNTIEMNINKIRWVIGTLIVVVPLTVALMIWINMEKVSSLESKLQAYSDSENWKLPETLQALGVLSQEFILTNNERNQFEQQKIQFIELNSKVTDLENQNLKYVDELNSLKSLIIVANEFEVEYGKSVELIKNLIVLGVENNYSTMITVRVDNNPQYMSLAETIPVRNGTFDCDLTLLQFDEIYAKFKFSCSEN